MCISGYISNPSLLKSNRIKNTLDLMKRRGPDANSFVIKNYNSKQLALLHTRLKIIDLDDRSNQPFVDENLTIVFNGEIYNYLEIKSKLKKNINLQLNLILWYLLRPSGNMVKNVLTTLLECGLLQYGTKKKKSYFYPEIILEKSHFIILKVIQVFFWFRN